MVIPNGILNNPPLPYVRQWMLHDMAREPLDAG